MDKRIRLGIDEALYEHELMKRVRLPAGKPAIKLCLPITRDYIFWNKCA